MKYYPRLLLLLTIGVWTSLAFARAPRATEEAETALATQEATLKQRYDRLELLAGRLAEMSKATQPRRAELLQQLVAKSREKDLPGRFDAIVDSLQQDDLGAATQNQTLLQTELQAMLELLLQEDRDRQIESERQRISKYLAELNKLIRQQRGIRARTAGGDSEQELGEDQQRTAENTDKLSDKIEKTEIGEQAESDQQAESQDLDGKPTEGENRSGKQSEGKPSDPQAGDTGKPSESQPGEPKSGESPPSESQPSESKPAESQSGQSGESSKSSPQQQSQSPSEKAVEKLRQAQERMKQAEERLQKAERDQAVEEQEAALRELEQAKAELEKILRQLREEEMERMLVLLEARIRKMLEAQNEVYERTVKLEESTTQVPHHELEIASASLGRKEDQIVNEADRALVLLREDGTSVAFPEALQQAREDMQTVADRLRRAKPDKITQGLEMDIIATLEETLAALQQALKDLREQKASQQSGGGQPGEQPLVDQLAELRMIRALQNRVNVRTEFYDKLIEGDRTQEAELLEALSALAERQEQIFEATRDLHQGANQ